MRSGDTSVFYKYIVIQLLDEYFVKTNRYSYSHITPALAPSRDGEGIYFISVEGSEGFSWEIQYHFSAKLKEFSPFVSAFREAGFDMQGDTSDVDDGRVSKNIILEVPFEIPASEYDYYEEMGFAIYEIPKQWKRIDLDGASCYRTSEQTNQFLADNVDSLRNTLGAWKYRLFELAYKRYGGGSFENPNRYSGIEAMI
ncbi:MAG: hypothetical protein P9M06_07125 [Candidatus Saelkia tenebricola]|nr:hypothetical protein [Candidatus Saelkia tenebricola]